jgi:hypothetical protein
MFRFNIFSVDLRLYRHRQYIITAVVVMVLALMAAA